MPNKKDISISTPKKGMNKDSHISALQQGEYTHAKNSNFEDENGNSYNIQNESSNLLANKFKNNYRVVGVKNDPFSNEVYYFLVNPITNVSEIGYIENKSILPDLGDTITNCGDCEYKVDLSIPLEEQEQQETQVYTTLLNDECNGCLNFNINKPIKSIEIKNEKCGRVMYFTDNLNPPRYIELDNINKYTFTGEELCGDETNVVDTCVACDKMRIFKRTQIFDISPSQIVLGGNLKRGTYEFIGAYSDELGNEISRYFSITNPISIFDEDNNILQQSEIADETNYAIKLEVKGLDLRYTHYKIAVIQTTDINRATSYFVEGIHSTSDNTILYTTDKDKQRATLSELTIPSIRVEKWETLTSSNGYLFGNGITYTKQMNLQPVMNLMSSFLNWQSYIAKEDLYKDGIASAKYKGYYREETYPFGVRFLLDGEYSPIYPFIGRPVKDTDIEVIINADAKSASKLAGSCIGTTIDKRWQIYDTATELGICPLSEEIPTNTIVEEEEKICYVQPNKQTYITLTGVAGSATITIDGTTYPITFTTDLTTTAANFVSTNSALISTNHNGLVVMSSDNLIILDALGWAEGDYESVEIANVDTDLNGQVKTHDYLTKETGGTFSISLDEADEFIDLETFIEDNKEACLSNPSTYPFCDLLNVDNYPDDNCTPSFNDGCTLPPLLSEEEINIVDVVGEKATRIEKEFPEEYSVLPPPSNCNLHARDFTTGGKQDDFYFRHGWMIGDPIAATSPQQYRTGVTYKRNYDSVNESCSYAEDIVKYNTQIGFINGYFHNYYGSDLEATTEQSQIESLQILDKATISAGGTLDNGYFTDFVHKGALWFKKEMTNERKVILNVTPQNVPTDQDQISEAFLLPDDPLNKHVRISFFDTCSSGTTIHSQLIDLTIGSVFMVELDSDNFLVITDDTGTVTTSTVALLSEEFQIAIDAPLVRTFGMEDPGIDTTPPDHPEMWDQPRVARIRTMPTQGCFGVNLTDILYDRVEVDFTSILINKKQTYTSQCFYEVPVLQDCEAYPNRFGEFAYVESTEEYPDNEGLYDSSNIRIAPEDIPEGEYFTGTTFQDYFKNNYAQDTLDSEGNYQWKTDIDEKPITDFRCKPIRHFKMPGNDTSPFMYDNNMAGFTESIIYPIGVTINEEIVNSFLDIAEKNGLITTEQRKSITGYEIVRGDRTANQSVVAKGLTFDMMKYTDRNKELLYSNYPFNDIGPDRLNYKDEDRNNFIEHPYNGTQNENWTFHSPETDYNKIASPAFMKVDGYMYGRSRGNFATVRDHPEYVILGNKLNNLASKLATTEVITETAVKSAQAFSNVNWLVGFANTVVPGGLISSIVILAIEAFSSMAFQYARYKYEWLQTFKNLGAPKNFASYYAAEGYYNHFKPNIVEGDMLRYLNVSKNIKGGRLIITDTVGGEKLEINHVDREKTMLLSTGKEYPITYATTYSEYDNGGIDINSASRTFASENNACEKGISQDISRNVASMYVTLKEYLPSQYGEIGSVRWLTTGYRGDLTNPQTGCQGIFGGDVFITRHTIKRSMPLFVATAMNQASLTPFEYKRYSNIGTEPRFYLNYEINNQDVSAGRPIPSLKSEYSFDCFSGASGDYVEYPSKFYLYYHGVPNFLTETTINTWNRYAKPEPWDNFYPNVGDLMEWTQEVVNPIRRGNSFFYNQTYSKNVTQTATLTLPVNYNQEDYDCRADAPSGTMYSLPDNSENQYVDPWLIFRPLDKYEFDTAWGDLIELRGIETAQVLARFDNTTAIFNAVDTLVDDGTNPATAVLGTGGIFARRPRTFSNTDLGHMGSQTQSMISCEYGHFFTDAKRGQVFKVTPGGESYEEISAYSNGQPSGMEKWFKKHLPFKILEYFPNIDVDNPYNGIGISMGWDSVYNRVFITKRDYVPNDENYCTIDGVLYDTSDDIIQPIIDNYTQQGYTYEGIENCRLKFTKNTLISSNTDIFAIYDNTGSFSGEGLQQVRDAMQSFYDNYVLSNPGYTGQLVNIDTTEERWLKNVSQVRDYYGGGNLNDKNPLYITFCNESRPDYHNTDLPINPVLINETQINDYETDFAYFLALYNQLESFKGVSYPIITTGASGSGNASYEKDGKVLVIQTLAAYYGENISQQEAASIPQNTVYTTVERGILEDYLINSNPYSVQGLKDLDWAIQTDLNDLSGTVITSQRLKTDLENLLGGVGGEETIVYVDLPEADFRIFKDVSWTISFNVKSGSWGSFFDFKPNYYVAHNDYFQTGINATSDPSEFGVWSHLLTNKSYNVFYGKAYDWEIEIPIPNKGASKYIETFSYDLDVRRYHNDYDYAENKYLGFEEAMIWNNSNNSGRLKLDLQRTLSQLSKYPKTQGDTQTILQSSQDSIFTFNYFYNRVKNDRAGLPLFNWDENQIEKELNAQAISFYNKRTLERLRGNTFLVNLKTSETQHKKIFKIAKTKENLYDR